MKPQVFHNGQRIRLNGRDVIVDSARPQEFDHGYKTYIYTVYDVKNYPPKPTKLVPIVVSEEALVKQN